MITMGVPHRVRLEAVILAQHKGLGFSAFADGDLLHAATRGDGTILSQDVAVAFALIAVMALDQQPMVGFAAGLIMAQTNKNLTPL